LRFGLSGELPTQPTVAPVAAPTIAPTGAISQTQELNGQEWVVTSSVVTAQVSGVAATVNVAVELKLNRWVGVGISSGGSQEMIGARAVVYDPADGSVLMYDFPSTSQSRFVVVADLTDEDKREELGISNLVAEQDDGVTTLSFDAAGLGDRPLISDVANSQGRLVFAHGSGNAFSQHPSSGRTARTIAFGGGGAPVGPEKKELSGRLAAHVTLMVVSWGILLPAGITSAMIRHLGLCSKGGKWFKFHQYLNSFGILFGTIGAIIGILLVDENKTPFTSSSHFPIGIIVTILGLIQALMGYLRPYVAKEGERKTTSRVVFEIGHRINGLITFVLSQVNILLGAALLVERTSVDTLMTDTLSYGEFQSIAQLVAVLALVSVFGFMAAGLLTRLYGKGGYKSNGTSSATMDQQEGARLATAREDSATALLERGYGIEMNHSPPAGNGVDVDVVVQS
jgi:hypothetical protein